MKICIKCKELKPLTTEYFSKHNMSKDGYSNECKMCRNQKLAHHWSVDKSKLRCIRCNEYKMIEEFDINKNSPHRNNRDRRCKCCKHTAQRNRRTQRSRADQFHRIFVERYQGMRDRAKKNGTLMEFTVESLKELYKKQKELCAISGVKMTYDLGKGRVPTNISVDQIDPSKGYTIANTQLVCMAVNQMKSDLNMEELLFFCKSIVKLQNVV